MNYIEFAKYYDKLIYDVNYDKVIDFIKWQKDKYNIEDNKLLELGCGTGNITNRLNGYNIIAVDYSEEMLTQARTKSANKRNIRYIESDIRQLNLERKFNIVIAVLDVINYILDIKDLKEIFENVYSHMSDNSIFIFDINSEYKIREIIGNNVFTDEVEDALYIWQGNFEPESKINSYLLTFFIKEKGNMYKRFNEEHKEKAYSLDEIIGLLEEVGFNKICLYDDYEDKNIEEKTQRITFVVRKE